MLHFYASESADVPEDPSVLDQLGSLTLAQHKLIFKNIYSEHPNVVPGFFQDSVMSPRDIARLISIIESILNYGAKLWATERREMSLFLGLIMGVRDRDMYLVASCD